jgi:hypothetical protein
MKIAFRPKAWKDGRGKLDYFECMLGENWKRASAMELFLHYFESEQMKVKVKNKF